MKHRYYYVVVLLCYLSVSATPFFVIKNSSNNAIESVVIDLRVQSASDCLMQYHELVTKFPQFIENYVPARVPVNLIMPETIIGFGPLEDAACFIEGARTALAWFKSYENYLEARGNRMHIIEASDFLDERNLCPVKLDNVRSIPVTFDEVWFERKSDKQCCLITGGAGFIGSHLTKQLLGKGFRVIVIDSLICATGQNILDLMDNPDFLFIQHDVSIPFSITTKIDYVIHAASIPSPVDYYKMPIETMRVGILGTLNTVYLAFEHHARYLFLSTSEVYGDPEVHPQVETYSGNVDCRSARAPYDQSKRGAETLIKLFIQKYPLDVRIARIFNTYGPGMRLRDGRIITNFTAALLDNKPMIIYGDGTQTRSLCYVDDMVAGLCSLLLCNLPDSPLIERVFNLGNPQEYTVNEIAQEFECLAKRYLPYSVTIKKIENPDKADPRKRKPDITRAISILHFEPQISFKEGLEKTFTYFMKMVCNE